MVERILILLSLTLLYSFNKFGYKTENNVIELNTKDFSEIINKHDFVLVNFYTEWCEHCKSMAEEYSKLSIEMSETYNIPVAKIDADKEKDLVKRYEVSGYPMIYLFIKRYPLKYDGNRDAKSIKEFILSKQNESIFEINSIQALEKLKSENNIIVTYLGGKNDKFLAFKNAAYNFEFIKFGYIKNLEIVKEINEEPGTIVIYKNFDDKINKLVNDFNVGQIINFVNMNRYARVMKFDRDVASRIFKNGTPGIILFQEDDKKQEKLFREASNEFNNMLFTISNIKSGLGTHLSHLFNISLNDLPCIRILQFKNNLIDKFKMKDEINEENLAKFINNFNNDLLEKYYISDPAPNSNNEDVKIVVGNTFKELVYDENKHVILFSYSKNCQHCQKFHPIFNELAKKFKNIKDLLFANFDSNRNEYYNHKVTRLPDIQLFKKGDKLNPIVFKENRTIEEIVKFLKENTDLKFSEEL